MPPAPFPPIDLEKEKAPLPSLFGHSKTILCISLVNLFEGLVPVTIGKACDEYGSVDRAVVDENVEWSLKENAGPFLHDVAPIPLKSKPPSIRTSGTPYHVMHQLKSNRQFFPLSHINDLDRGPKSKAMDSVFTEGRRGCQQTGKMVDTVFEGIELLVPLHVGFHVI
ncbi:hypothetical protein OIU74_003508 [Salix koriyanagi]|uniref:Uncharacterized protein n=1 Tax=Salix koriyanagi TaxID=2511006 RepID=A0A9Q0UZJ4_9ROSI|nr:hypothetical protein OIU74_003508 [Salix koriyanagi]